MRVFFENFYENQIIHRITIFIQESYRQSYSPEGSFGEGEAVFADPFDTEIPGGRFIEEEQDLFSLILKLALDCTEIPGGRLSFFVSPPDELFDCTEIPGGSLDRLAGAAGLSSLVVPANVAKNGNES